MKILVGVCAGVVCLGGLGALLSAPERTPDHDLTTGSATPVADSLVGVFEGRTPCGVLLVEFAGYGGGTCEKMKWRLTLYRDGAGGGPTRYAFEGTRVRREGRWTIERGTPERADDVVYRLATDLPVKSIALLRVDDNILLFLDPGLRPMVGDASWSYTLSRVK